VGNGHLEKGQGGDGRGLGMRHGRGVHDDTLVVRGRFGGTGSTDGTHGSARAGERRVAGLTSGAQETGRASVRAHRRSTSTSRPHWAARDRGGERACGLALTGGGCLSGKSGRVGAGARARLGWLGLVGPKWSFPFSWNF
jgi:hypothetical protein